MTTEKQKPLEFLAFSNTLVVFCHFNKKKNVELNTTEYTDNSFLAVTSYKFFFFFFSIRKQFFFLYVRYLQKNEAFVSNRKKINIISTTDIINFYICRLSSLYFNVGKNKKYSWKKSVLLNQIKRRKII